MTSATTSSGQLRFSVLSLANRAASVALVHPIHRQPGNALVLAGILKADHVVVVAFLEAFYLQRKPGL